MFWRGAVYAWNDDGSIPVRLGPFQEQFRQYLLGLKAFPQDCSLLVMVREEKDINRLTYEPIGNRKGKFHAYRFPMPGLAFILFVSKNIPADYRKACFVYGSGHPVFVTTLIDQTLGDDVVKMFSGIFSGRKNIPPR